MVLGGFFVREMIQKLLRPRMLGTALLACIVLTSHGCSSPTTGGSQEVSYGHNGKKTTMTQVMLQEDLQRLTSNFIESLASSMQTLIKDKSPEVRQAAMRQLLRYASSILDIASAPYPEVNLLDMAVFLRLNREVLQDYWIPTHYGANGYEILEVFREAERKVQEILSEVSTPAQQARLTALIDKWRAENPDQTHVEWVRLYDFTKKIGNIEAQRSEEVGGLMASVKGAVVSADQIVLMGNRAMFLGQRIPFLLRLQARIGAQEIVSDTIGELAQGGKVVDRITPLVESLSNMVTQMNLMMENANPVMAGFRKYFPLDTSSTFTQKLSMGESITGNLLRSFEEVNNSSLAKPAKPITESLFGGLTKVLLLVGAAWSLFWWTGYYIAKRATAKFEPAVLGRRERALVRRERRARKPPSDTAA